MTTTRILQMTNPGAGLNVPTNVVDTAYYAWWASQGWELVEEDDEPLPFTNRLISGAELEQELDTRIVAERALARATYGAALPVALQSRRTGRAKEYPTIVKYPDNPVFTKAQQTLGSIYWLHVIDVDGFVAPGARVNGHRYYWYYSTDHGEVTPGHANEAGIGMATSNDPYGSDLIVTPYIYRDIREGGQSETPTVLLDTTAGLFRLFYQVRGVGFGIQSTVQATSPDGHTWTYVGVVVDVPSANKHYAGDGHTGYFRFFYYAGALYAFHLLGGTAYSNFGLSRSEDGGATWTMDGRQIGPQRQWMPSGSVEKVKWGLGVLIEYRGRLWNICAVAASQAGGEIADNKWWAGPVRDDLRGFAAHPIDVTPPHQAWENDLMDVPDCALVVDDKIIIFYRGGGAQGAFGAAEVTVAS